jgi:hypothetical protein
MQMREFVVGNGVSEVVSRSGDDQTPSTAQGNRA